MACYSPTVKSKFFRFFFVLHFLVLVFDRFLFFRYRFQSFSIFSFSFRFSFCYFFVSVLVFVNEFIIHSFLTIFVFVFVNENHTAVYFHLEACSFFLTLFEAAADISLSR